MILGIDCSRYASPQPTGVELYTDRVVEGLVHQADHLGYDRVRLYVRNALQVERLLNLIDEYGQKNVDVVLIERQRLWTLLGLSWELFRNKIDVLFVPSHTLPLVVPQQIVWTPHGMEGEHFPQAYSWSQRSYRHFSMWWAKRKGARFIAISKSVKKDLMKFFQIDASRITVIYNGYDPVIPESSQAKRERLKKKPFVTGDFILSVGRLEERKNQVRLVEAFELLSSEFNKLKLVLVGGDGYGVEKVRKKVEASSVRERIYLAGYQDQDTVDRLLEKAQVFAYPSLAEGFGIPLLEAFQAGCPVLTSKGMATEEVAGGAAVLCDPLSVDSIAEGLKQLLKDRSLRKQLREQGRERLEVFSWEKCVKETLAILKNSSEL